MDLSFLQDQLKEHGFLIGILVGTVLPAVAGPILSALTKASLGLTAKLIPPLASAVKRGVIFAMAIPLVRAFVVPNKEAVKKLEDTIIDEIRAVILAVDTAFDEALDAAAAEPAKTPPAIPPT